MIDLVLASAHHLLVFGLVAILAAELATVRPGLSGVGLRRLGIIDAHYGVIAGLVIAVGFARVFWGVKGPDAYLDNWVFWTKFGAFLLAGLLSAAPTIRFLAWRKQAAADPAFALTPAHIAQVRPWILGQAVVMLFIPILGAAMARGYGT